jgi:hypothetical protein
MATTMQIGLLNIDSPDLERFKPFSTDAEFKKCEPFEIVDFYGKNDSKRALIVIGKQNNKSFLIWHRRDDYYTPTYYINKSMFSDVFPFKNRDLVDGGKKVKSNDLVCKSSVFIGMHMNEFIFVYGYPTKINTTVTSNITMDQLVFGNIQSGLKFFYFYNGILKSWQN